MTLIEVLVAVLILGVGLLGAAMIQLNALKYTDSSRMTSQASFIAYDLLDRIRDEAGLAGDPGYPLPGYSGCQTLRYSGSGQKYLEG